MAIDRRTILVAAATAGAELALLRRAARADRSVFSLAAARRTQDGRYEVAVFTPVGRELRSVPLPDRGHDLAICPVSRRVVAFARRPGRFAVVIDLQRKAKPITFETPPDRHFYGHGVFARTGKLLYSTENDFETGRGVVGVYDATDRFRRIGELPSHGVGPHDMGLSGDGRKLIIANGGRREHPDVGGGRRVLNPDAIETSLVYADAETGDLIEKHELPNAAGLSLRHFEVGINDIVVIGAQRERPLSSAQTMLFTHTRQQPLLKIDCGAADPFGGYVSSIAVDTSGGYAAATSSRTGSAVVVEIATGAIVGKAQLRDVSGIARGQGPRSFWLTSGTGAIASFAVGTGAARSLDVTRVDCQWDNHAVAIA